MTPIPLADPVRIRPQPTAGAPTPAPAAGDAAGDTAAAFRAALELIAGTAPVTGCLDPAGGAPLPGAAPSPSAGAEVSASTPAPDPDPEPGEDTAVPDPAPSQGMTGPIPLLEAPSPGLAGQIRPAPASGATPAGDAAASGPVAREQAALQAAHPPVGLPAKALAERGPSSATGSDPAPPPAGRAAAAAAPGAQPPGSDPRPSPPQTVAAAPAAPAISERPPAEGVPAAARSLQPALSSGAATPDPEAAILLAALPSPTGAETAAKGGPASVQPGLAAPLRTSGTSQTILTLAAMSSATGPSAPDDAGSAPMEGEPAASRSGAVSAPSATPSGADTVARGGATPVFATAPAAPSAAGSAPEPDARAPADLATTDSAPVRSPAAGNRRNPPAATETTAALPIAPAEDGSPAAPGPFAAPAEVAGLGPATLAGPLPDRSHPHGAHAPLPAGFGHRLAETVAHFPDRPVELTLSPEELGRVKMTLTTQDGALSLAIQADRPETVDLMRRHIDQLAQDFRDLGFTSLSFSFAQGDASTAGGQDRGDAAPAETEAEIRSAATISNPHPAARDHASGGLDLRL